MPTNKQKPNGRQVPTATSNYRIPYEDAVAEGKDIIKKMDDHQMRLGELQTRLGELADRIDQTKYRDRTLAKFAKAIGYQACTLKRHRSVYRAWEGAGKKAPGLSYAVRRELQNHPERVAIVKKKPTITRREAQELMREWKQQQEGKHKKSKSPDGKSEQERWLRQVVSFVNDIKHTAAEMMRHKGATRALREIAEPELLAMLLPKVREGSAALLSQADQLEHLLDEDIENAEGKAPDLKEAEREGVAA